jgi:hypothetical protein
MSSLLLLFVRHERRGSMAQRRVRVEQQVGEGVYGCDAAPSYFPDP